VKSGSAEGVDRKKVPCRRGKLEKIHKRLRKGDDRPGPQKKKKQGTNGKTRYIICSLKLRDQ